MSPDTPLPATQPHTRWEDAQALLAGCLFVALAVLMFRHAGLVTGGTTGVAFLMHYISGWPLGAVLFALNLPFYVFGWRALGTAFTVKTFMAVGLLSFFVEALPHWVAFAHLNTVFASAMAGLLAGAGILILIRHGASLGGVTIMAIYLQKRRGWRAGSVQNGGGRSDPAGLHRGGQPLAGGLVFAGRSSHEPGDRHQPPDRPLFWRLRISLTPPEQHPTHALDLGCKFGTSRERAIRRRNFDPARSLKQKTAQPAVFLPSAPELAQPPCELQPWPSARLGIWVRRGRQSLHDRVFKYRLFHLRLLVAKSRWPWHGATAQLKG